MYKEVQKQAKHSQKPMRIHKQSNYITHEALQGSITETHGAPKSTPRAQKHRKHTQHYANT